MCVCVCVCVHCFNAQVLEASAKEKEVCLLYLTHVAKTILTITQLYWLLRQKQRWGWATGGEGCRARHALGGPIFLPIGCQVCRVGQNRTYTPYIYPAYLVISLPKIPYIHRISMGLANPTSMQS